MKPTTIAVPGLKVTVVLLPDQLPSVPPEPAPAGEPIVDLVLPGGALTVRAKLNGKSVRKLLRQVAELGADAVVVVLQGKLIPPPAPGEPFVLDGAGFQVTVKQPKPATPE
jgi:hypothetical protein